MKRCVHVTPSMMVRCISLTAQTLLLLTFFNVEIKILAIIDVSYNVIDVSPN